jgi:DNA-binding beta-propeller fold protein YncE/ketosteroid isomerase-like protein
MKKGAVLLLLLLPVIFVACGGVSASEVERDLYANLDKGDAAGALALTTEDAVFDIPGCPDGGCKGKDAVKGAFERVVAQHPRHTVKSSKASGNTATSQVEDELDLAKAAGVQRVVLKANLEVKGGKIIRYRAQFDTSDQQTATVVNFLQVTGLLQDFFSKVDKGDVTGALALTTDNAVFEVLGCPADGCKGKAAVKGAIEAAVAQHASHAIKSSKVSGNTATSQVEAVLDLAKAAGADRILVTFTAEVKDGKLTLLRAQPDASDQKTATFANFARVSGVVTRHYEGLNRGEVATALAAFADDGTLAGVGLCAATPCVGKAAIQKELERQVANKVRIALVRRGVSGDTENSQTEVRSDFIKAAGVERVIAALTVEVKGDRITAWRWVLDASDPQTATSLNFARLSGLLRQHYEAINKWDAAATATFFTDDAALVRGGCPPQTPCVGTAAIQIQLGRDRTIEYRYSVISIQVSGDTATGRAEFRNLNIKNSGLERVIETFTATFKGDKISRLVHELDVSDSQTAAFANFRRVQGIRATYSDASNLGNVAGAMAALTDDAVFEGYGLCAAAPCAGKAAIQKEVERQVADKTKTTPVGGTGRVTGDTHTEQIEVRSDSIKAAAVERIIVSRTVEAKGGKASLIRWAPDSTDPQTATYIAGVLLRPVAYEVWVIDQADAAKGGAKLYIYKKSQVEGERLGGSPEVIDLNAAATGVGDGPGVRPHLIDFNKDHTYAVVANVASGHVYFIRASDRKMVASIDVGEQAHGAVVSPDGSLVLAANQNGKKLARIKADFEKGIFTYNKADDLDLKALEDPGHPDNAPICPLLFPQGGKKAYVTVRGGGLYIIDTSTTPMKVVKSFTKDEVAPAGCGGIALGQKVYINSGTATSSNLYVFDSDTDSLKKSLDLSTVGKDGHGMVLVGNGRYLWMGHRASHNIVVIDTQTDTQAGVITGFGNAPDIMDASPKGDLVFVALRGPNNLTGGPTAKGQTPGMVVLQTKEIGASMAKASFLAIGDQSAESPVDPHVLAVRIVGQ